MKKEELRRCYKSRRATLPGESREQMSVDIANRLLSMDIWKYSFFHIFLPIERLNEINTHHILTILQGKDKNIVLPKTDMNTQTLTHILLTDNTILRKSDWGIVEPENGIEINSQQIDVVFMPLLAYDGKGNRVGYGKGYYDRFLLECKPDIVKIGISYFGPDVQIDNVSATDIPLDYCVTPSRVYDFR
ncbi:MAG: 5-formyltetrahydrofolate cyclo-ligase [Capnocytophaga sp.]|nr:5-formyltetrahydrofolate cyclo-ligase [Capnocytophaga sp.]